MNRRAAGPTVVGIGLALLLCLLVVPMLVVGGTAMLFAGGDGSTCGSTTADAVQPAASTVAANSIPASYLHWFQLVGLQYNVPWTVLAGIGKVESDDGQTTLPGVNSGANAFGAAGPMQIGIEGASGDAWATVATVEDGNPPASVYDPADAIAGAAKYLIAHGIQQNVPAAIFAYNHADWYVQEVLSWASTYASGGYTVSEVTPNGDGTADATVVGNTACTENSMLASVVAPNTIVQTAINYAEDQLGKPYLFGGTGPAAFDCSGLVMMAYRAAGVTIAAHLSAAVGRPAARPRREGAPGRPGVLRRRGRYRQVARARWPGNRQELDDRGVRDRHGDPRLPVRNAAVGPRRHESRRLRPTLE